MKKSIYLLAGAMAMMAIGCSESSEPIETPLPEKEVQPAPISIGVHVAETRMNYERSDDNRSISVTWGDSDKLDLYKVTDNTNSVTFSMGTNNGKSAIFTADEQPSFSIGDSITALYPASSIASTSAVSETVDSNVTTRKMAMKDQVIGVNGEGDASVDLMIAHSTWQDSETSLTFTRLMSSIVLVLDFDQPTTVKNIVLTEGGEGFNNYGEVVLNDADAVQFTNTMRGPMSATIDNPVSSSQFIGQVFFIPGTYSNISVTVITDKGHFINTRTGTNVTLEANKNYRLQVAADDWDIAPLYAWSPADNFAIKAGPGYTPMTSATDSTGLYFYSDLSESSSVWGTGSNTIKFTLTDLSYTWAVFMGSSFDGFSYYPEYEDSFTPYGDSSVDNILRVDVLNGTVKIGRRRNIYYTGTENGYTNTSDSSYQLKCDIDDENRIDEYTIRGLTFNNGDKIKFALDSYVNWDNDFIRAQTGQQIISNGVTHTYVVGNANGDNDIQFYVDNADNAGIYDITINVVDQTITFNKQ